MSTSGVLSVNWLHREPPLTPSAVAAWGSSCIKEFVGRLSLRNEANVKRARFVIGENILVMLAAEDDLPWAEGVIYLASQPGTNLLLPTSLIPSVPPQLFERAFNNRFPRTKPPLAVLPTIPAIFSLADSFATNVDSLKKYAEKL